MAIMYRTMLKSKIHRVTVSQGDPHGMDSVTVDEELMEAADLLPGEKVSIVDVTNGARLETYVVKGERGSGIFAITGAAAPQVSSGDLVILLSCGQLDSAEAAAYEPRIVLVYCANRIVKQDADPEYVPADSGLLSGVVFPPVGETMAAFPVAETADAVRLDALLHPEG